MTTHMLNLEIPVIGEYDVVVCGGGPGGFAAAVAAARSGCRTVLIEKYSFLGGTATGGYVNPISRYNLDGRRVVGGISWELVERLTALGAAQAELPKGHVSYDGEVYKLVAQRMAQEAGVTLMTNTVVADVVCEGNTVTGIVAVNKGGMQVVRGKIFIDGTGDADLFFRAGAPMLEGSGNLQPMSTCFLLDNVDTSTDLLKNYIHHDGLHGASKQMEIFQYLESLKETRYVPMFGGPWFNTTMHENQVAVNITRSATDATDPEALTKAECKMREDAFTLIDLLKERYPEFKNAFIAATAVNGGVRETRHIRGIRTLTGEDMRTGSVTDEAIALCAHPVDVHSSTDNTQTATELRSPCGIPYGCMVTPGFPNLLCAGRTVSADAQAFASLRVQAQVMAIGEAAGTAAKMMLETGCSAENVDVAELRKRLLAAGGILK